MKMKLSDYNKIIDKFYEVKTRDCIPKLASFFPEVPYQTLKSIVFQEYQRKTKKTYYKHTKKAAEYYQRYLRRAENSPRKYGYLLQMADEIDMSPALMAKLMVEYHYKNGLGYQEKEPIRKTMLSEMMKDTSLIKCKDLAAEVRMCVLADEHYGFISDVTKNSVGNEYEGKLKEDLKKLGFSFIDEKQLREKGFDKTPDIKLEIPIVVDGHIVNWIESKASFGDVKRHQEYLRDQYWSYCNRFGPGLVIYWVGYIDELNDDKEKGIILSDQVPTAFTYMNPSILMKKSYIDKIV